MSIPLRWAERHDIEAGDTAYLYPNGDGSLLIHWGERERGELAATQIPLVDADPQTAIWAIRSAYTAGFDRFTLCTQNAFTSKQRQAISACARRLVGAEIFAETDRRVTIRDMLDSDDLSLRQLLLQQRSTALSMNEAMTELVVGELDRCDRTVDRDDDADRIFRLITRQFNRSLSEHAEPSRVGTSRQQLFEYYVTARQFERIADHAVKIVRFVRRTDRDISGDLLPEVRSISADARRIVKEASDVVLGDGSRASCRSALERRERVIRRARDLDLTLLDRAPADAYVLTRTLDSLIRTAKHGGNIAELRLRASLLE
ncbi:MAG: PhoU domain-containing protein [Halapricum sp.]